MPVMSTCRYVAAMRYNAGHDDRCKVCRDSERSFVRRLVAVVPKMAGDAPLSLWQRLLYAVCGILPGGILYILITLVGGIERHLSHAVIFGLVAGLLFPHAARSGFLFLAHRYQLDEEEYDAMSDRYMLGLAIAIIVGLIILAVNPEFLDSLGK